MNPILESIWKPTDKDLLAGINQRRYVFGATLVSQSATLITLTTPAVPQDTVRVIQGLSARLAPGAAQRATSFQANALIVGALSGLFVGKEAPVGIAAAQAFGDTITNIGWILGVGNQISIDFRFDLGGVPNSGVACIWGFDLPRANVEV